MKWLGALILLSLLVALAPAPASAQEADEQYLRAFNMISQADLLTKNKQPDPARKKYQEAQAVLLEIRKATPAWCAKAVAYRLNYVADKISALSPKAAASGLQAEAESKPGVRSAGLPAGTQVRLLEAGAEPRKLLRFQPHPGEKQTVSMSAKSSMGAGETAGGMMKLPTIKMTLEVMPKSVSAEGDIDCEMTVADISVAEEAGTVPQMVEGMKAMMQGAKGMVVTTTIADRGFVKKADLKIAPGTPAETREVMEQMKDSFAEGEIIFPQEAVGAGARWEVKHKAKEEGATIDETSTYQVVSIEGDILAATGSTEQRAANQKVTSPMDPKAKADLIKLSGSTTAKVTFDLTKVMPTEGTSEEHSEKTISLSMGGQKQTMTIKSEMLSRIESK